MSSPAQSESDGPEVDPDDVPGQRSTPEHSVDNTVTRIMPVIAPWPKPGSEPPNPPTPRAIGAAPVEPRVDVADPGDVPATPGTAVVLAPRRSADIVRAGPTAIAEDSWDEPPESVLEASGVGGRHAKLPSRRVWVALVAVLIGLGAIAGVPFVLSSQPAAPTAAPDESPTELDEPPPGFVPGSAYVQSPAPLSTGQSATPAPSPSPTQVQAANPTVQSTTNPPEPPPFAPLTIEAESGTTTGSAWVWNGYPNASGGLIVRNLGDWDTNDGPGTLALSGIVFPTDGTYTITVYFVHPNDEDNRSALVTVSGLEGVTVNFTAVGPDCCYVKAFTLAVPAGTRSITFANATDHAPSIDKIVITRA